MFLVYLQPALRLLPAGWLPVCKQVFSPPIWKPLTTGGLLAWVDCSCPRSQEIVASFSPVTLGFAGAN